MSQIQICENCCVYLEPHTKKLGEKSKWLRCPECGMLYRESELDRTNKNRVESLIDRNKLGNKSGFTKPNYNDWDGED